MILNILRTGVDVNDVDHLSTIMKRQNFDYNGQKARIITTRYRPKDYEMVLQTGGSIYWIIKGMIQARQKILDFIIETEVSGKSFCQILLSPQVIKTELYPHRAVQGWRYLKQDQTPADLPQNQTGIGDLPSHMVKDLRLLGLI